MALDADTSHQRLLTLTQIQKHEPEILDNFEQFLRATYDAEAISQIMAHEILRRATQVYVGRGHQLHAQPLAGNVLPPLKQGVITFCNEIYSHVAARVVGILFGEIARELERIQIALPSTFAEAEKILRSVVSDFDFQRVRDEVVKIAVRGYAGEVFGPFVSRRELHDRAIAWLLGLETATEWLSASDAKISALDDDTESLKQLLKVFGLPRVEIANRRSRGHSPFKDQYNMEVYLAEAATTSQWESTEHPVSHISARARQVVDRLIYADATDTWRRKQLPVGDLERVRIADNIEATGISRGYLNQYLEEAKRRLQIPEGTNFVDQVYDLIRPSLTKDGDRYFDLRFRHGLKPREIKKLTSWVHKRLDAARKNANEACTRAKGIRNERQFELFRVSGAPSCYTCTEYLPGATAGHANQILQHIPIKHKFPDGRPLLDRSGFFVCLWKY